MSERTENKYLVVPVKVDGEEVMALIRPFGYWLCPPCRRKLVHALDWPEQN